MRRKKGEILVNTFLFYFFIYLFFFVENILYIWKYFVLNIRADSSCLPKLLCSPAAMIKSLMLMSVYTERDREHGLAALIKQTKVVFRVRFRVLYKRLL